MNSNFSYEVVVPGVFKIFDKSKPENVILVTAEQIDDLKAVINSIKV